LTHCDRQTDKQYSDTGVVVHTLKRQVLLAKPIVISPPPESASAQQVKITYSMLLHDSGPGMTKYFITSWVTSQEHHYATEPPS